MDIHLNNPLHVWIYDIYIYIYICMLSGLSSAYISKMLNSFNHR